MDRMERIREGVRRRYLAASSRARLIRERDDCDGEISSKLDSKFKRLVAALVAAFDFHSGGLSCGHLGIRRCWISARFYFKLRVDALFSCSQALNRTDFEAEQQNPRKLRLSRSRSPDISSRK